MQVVIPSCRGGPFKDNGAISVSGSGSCRNPLVSGRSFQEAMRKAGLLR